MLFIDSHHLLYQSYEQEYMEETLQQRLRIRANIRRNAKGRKSVEEGKPDRLADLLDEAADHIDRLESEKRRRENRWTV